MAEEKFLSDLFSGRVMNPDGTHTDLSGGTPGDTETQAGKDMEKLLAMLEGKESGPRDGGTGTP